MELEFLSGADMAAGRGHPLRPSPPLARHLYSRLFIYLHRRVRSSTFAAAFQERKSRLPSRRRYEVRSFPLSARTSGGQCRAVALLTL